MTNYQELSELELRSLIEKAETALKNKQANKRREVIAKIREMAASIDATVEIYDQESKAPKASTKLPAKFRHPDIPENTWTGRGITPRWLKALLDQGRKLDEFKI